MAALPILCYPDPRLHTVAKPVVAVNDAVRQLVADMAQTMYEAPGIGLAATQVNVHQQVIVIDLSDERDQLQVFINPEIVWSSEEKKVWQEGCLSVPDFFDEVLRPSEVKVRALNLEGKPFEIHADGLLAVCIQHEMDHLKGKVFVEYLSSLKRMRIAGKLKKKTKAGAL
jgi:peptide deformylase